jgi:hypothetical protein
MASLSNMKVVRTVEIRAESSGTEKVRAALEGVTDAHEKMGRAATHAAIVTEQATKRELSALSTLEREMRKIDQQFRATQNVEKATGAFDRAVRQGLIDQQRRDQLVSQADEHYNRLSNAARGGNDNDPARKGLSTYDKQFVRYQAFDVASTLGSGGSLTTAAFQQGPQLLQQLADRDGGLKQGLKELGVSALGLINPVTLAGTAVVGLGVAFGVAASQASKDREALERATQGIGAGTGATVSQLDAIARSNAELGKVSTSTSREIVAGYASMGSLGVPIITDLTRVTSEYARITGQETAAATTELGRAFSDLTSGVDTIASRMGALGDATRQLITAQMEQGNQSGAQQTLADALKASIDANAQSTAGWAGWWREATKAADGYWEAAKRIAGIKLGVAPEGAAEAVTRLRTEVENTNRIRQFSGLNPLDPETSSKARDLQVAEGTANQERLIAQAKADRERAAQASATAGRISRSIDPNYDAISRLREQQTQLGEALAVPSARAQLSDFKQTETAYLAVSRAIETMTDANGRLISTEERTRIGNQLQIDAAKAKTDAEKALVAERQKAYDLAGKAITGSDARSQIEMAGRLSRINSASSTGGGKSDSDTTDEYDRAMKSAEDRIRRMDQEAQTFGMGAQAVAHYRAETDLLTAAKRAERDITPTLTAQIQDYANKAGEAAQRQEELREKMQDMDALRSGGRDVISSIGRDLAHGASQADIMANAIGRLSDRLMDMATSGISDSLFGKRGGSDSGLLGGLFSSMFGGGGGGGGLSSLFGGGGPDLNVGSDASFLFANGGIMTSRGAMPLNAYASGGIANSPQMAIFGEGRTPEAYVPLPDGKRIPVAMQGNAPVSGGGGPISVNHSPTYNVTPASGVTPGQLAEVMDRNNQEFAKKLPALIKDADRRRF